MGRRSHRWLIGLALLLLSADPASAQRDMSLPKPGNPESVDEEMLRADNEGANGQVLSKVANPSTHKMDFRWITPEEPQIYMGTVGEISGGAVVYISPTSASQVEDRVQIRVGQAVTFNNLRCVSSAAPSQNVTIVGRVGTCGSLANDDDMSCTIAASSSTCDDSHEMSVASDQCFAFRVAAAAALSSNVVITCWADRS